MDIQALLALQEEDGRLRDLQRELKTTLPARHDAAKARLAEARKVVEKAVQENLDAIRLYERYQHDYTRSHDRMNRAEANAMGQTSARALSSAAKEHADAAQAAAEAAEARDAADKNRTPTERKLDEARHALDQEEILVQEIFDAIDARKKRVEEELAKVKDRRAALVAEVPPTQLKYYERLKLTRWPCAVEYNRTEGVCTGCNLVQPPSVTQAVLHADKNPGAPLVTCPACGRILI